ncbi:MAG: FG-GAP-like repeat-containing protein [Verrucomicrobiota bacterium]
MTFSGWSADSGTGFSIPANKFRIWGLRLNSTKTVVNFFDTDGINDFTATRNTSGLGTPAAGYYVGSGGASVGNNYQFRGDIAEVIYYRGTLIDAERTSVENYLRGKYFSSAGSFNVGYQWQVNGTNIVGATNSSLTLSNVQPANAGSYSVTVTNLAGSVTSSNAVLTVITPIPVPRITSFSPGSGPVGTAITIAGENFSPIASNNIVWFGAVAAQVLTATPNQLTVLVPTYASQAPITVEVDGLVYAAPAPFVVTYSGTGTFSASSLATSVNLPAGNAPVGVKIVDLDGDGKADLVVANYTDSTISVYRNISTNGVLTSGSFAPRVTFAVGTTPRQVAIGDIDGDGKRDIAVANNGGSTVSVFRNTSTPGVFTTNSLAAKVDFTTGINPLQLALVDLNADGKLDLAIAVSAPNTLTVLRNTATVGSITADSFAAKVDFPGTGRPGGLAVGDIDGDGKPDVALSNDTGNSLSLFRNTTLAGNATITFAAKVDFATPARPYSSVSMGDLDGDGKLDIAVAAYSGGSVSVFRNISTVGVITTNSLAARFDLATGGSTHEVLVVDIDGDSKSDLVAVSEYANAVAVFRNRSTNGTLVAGSFAPRVDFATALNPGGVAVGDLDGDGRPDVVAATSYGNVLSLLQNINSPFPTITTQPQSRTVVAGTTVTLAVAAIGSQPLIYYWQINGTNIVGATNASLVLSNAQPAQSGNYRVVVTNQSGSVTSDVAVVRVRYLFPLGNGQTLSNSQSSFVGSAQISFQSSFANGMIFYTLDGSTPSFTSISYTGPFALDRSATLRAIVYSADFLQSGESDPVNITIIPTYTLTGVTAGGGSVAIGGVGPFLGNTVVNVTANPSNGWTFLQWLGDASGTNPMTTVTLTRNKSVRAVFGTGLNTTVAGNGAVVLNPASGLYPFGSVVRLTAVPDAGSFFGVWGNAASGNTNPLDFVIITPNPTVSSLFSTLGAGQFALTLSAEGFGGVSASPRANSYSSGQIVTLTATPDSGQTFLGWTGDASGTTSSLLVTMSQSRNITANFSKSPRLAVQSTPATVKLEGFQFTLNGALGESYSLQKSSNLVDWATFVTVTNSFGTTQFSDLPSTNSGAQFYRATQP